MQDREPWGEAERVERIRALYLATAFGRSLALLR
jgi:hypothetical protein